MTFNITTLTGHRAVVQGTDAFGTSGQQVVDTRQWDEIQRTLAQRDAAEVFDAEVKEFFAPLAKASEAFEKAGAQDTDDFDVFVFEEGVDSTPGQPQRVVALSYDSMILRALQTPGEDDRLMWVNGFLEILAKIPVSVDEPVPYEVADTADTADTAEG